LEKADKHSLVIAGIGTDIGKTVVSAIFAEALKAHYWKPVQAGDLSFSDSMKVRAYCSDEVHVLPERYLLNTAVSPHLSARLDGVVIDEHDFELPEVEGNLIIEGAGGLMVPLNDTGFLYIDLIKHWKLPVVLVSRHYLGSINHTLLSLEILKQSGIAVHTIVFIGAPNEASESVVLKRFPPERVIHIPLVDEVNAAFVREQAEKVASMFSRED